MVDETGKLARTQVKYRAAKDGVVEVGLRSIWSDRNGVHTKTPSYDQFDAVAVFCPNTTCVYYVLASELSGIRSSFVIRLSPSEDGQTKRVRLASTFTNPLRVFAPVAKSG